MTVLGPRQRQRQQQVHQKQEKETRRARKRDRKQIKEAHLALDKAQRTEAKQPTGNTQTFVPSLGLLFRILSIVRIIGALKAPMLDCDEVYNYWEPLHFVQFGSGKQTWEYATQYALRSYGFVWMYGGVAKALHFVFGFTGKIQVFYAVRIACAVASAFCEAVFVRAIADNVDRRIAVYTLVGLAAMPGMFHQAAALLPSTFSMYFVMLALAASMAPPRVSSSHLARRAVPAISAFSVAACCGWPYSAVVAVPFIVEELVERGRVLEASRVPWAVQRIVALGAAGAATCALCLGVFAACDAAYYGKLTVAAWNQVAYNVLGTRGPELYGTEPWHFYIINGVLNANILMLLALLSLPLWITYYAVLRTTVDNDGQDTPRSAAFEAAVARLYTSHRLLLYRILPFYVVFGVFSAQAHKEERFLAIAYPSLCFNAAVALSLLHPLRAWARTAVLGLGAGEGRSWSDKLNMSVLAVSVGIGVMRSLALTQYYSAPADVLLGLPELQPTPERARSYLPIGPSIKQLLYGGSSEPGQSNETATVCMGDDWHRFPSTYWLPQGYALQFVQSGFDGHLPGDFNCSSEERSDFNDRNEFEPRHVVDASACDYMVDTEHVGAGGRAFAADERVWEKVRCRETIDAQMSSVVARVVFWPTSVIKRLGLSVARPGGDSEKGFLVWAETCLLKRKSGQVEPLAL